MDVSVVEQLGLVVVAAGGGGGHGGGGEHGGAGFLFVASLFINFLIFFGFLFWKAAPAVANGLRSRRANMAKELEAAQKKQAEAEARLAEYQEKLDNLEREVARVIQSYEREAEADRARTQVETEKALARMARETDFTIEQEMRKAQRLIRASAVEATIKAAEEKIQNRITLEDQIRLTDQYIQVLNNGSNP